MENYKFKPNDKVKDKRYGDGVVYLVDERLVYPVRVKFYKHTASGSGSFTRAYTIDGRVECNQLTPMLVKQFSVGERLVNWAFKKLKSTKTL